MIPWREKATAFAVHFLVTLAVVCGRRRARIPDLVPGSVSEDARRDQAVRDPGHLRSRPRAADLLHRLQQQEVAPCVAFDYTVVGIIQLGAFVYGVYAVANTRPAYIVFVGDRLEVVSAGEIDDADLAQGGDRIASDRDGDLSRRNPGAAGSEGARKELFSALQARTTPYCRFITFPTSESPGDQATSATGDRARKAPSGSEAAARMQRAAASARRKARLVAGEVSKRIWTVLLDPDTGHRELVAGRSVRTRRGHKHCRSPVLIPTARNRRMAQVRIGVSGWRYTPWRGVFYPRDLPQRLELRYASRIFPHARDQRLVLFAAAAGVLPPVARRNAGTTSCSR